MEKRVANEHILKNRGLTSRHNRAIKNPRVKHRKKFEKATKKLQTSQKTRLPVAYHRYRGEITGIKTHVSHSISLN
jgi:U3 small nucleolar RNA-associated protein 3